ncbi:hypothetical protein SK128_026208 [Halocaridina rubra]|uniref:Tetratricopeptide repeat protein n=1 Tax=Halocaridina rubra TaxID=373956 RepID=A0AAN8WBJ7_HALRR
MAALTNYANLSHDQRDDEHAYALYSRALEETWKLETATSLARLCLLTNRLSRAEDLLNKIISYHQPPHSTAMVYLAQVKIQQRQYTASETLLRGVLKASPKHLEALYQLSLLYTATNRSDDALEVAREAATACFDPGEQCAHLHAHYADLLHTLSLTDDAITVNTA